MTDNVPLKPEEAAAEKLRREIEKLGYENRKLSREDRWRVPTASVSIAAAAVFVTLVVSVAQITVSQVNFSTERERQTKLLEIEEMRAATTMITFVGSMAEYVQSAPLNEREVLFARIAANFPCRLATQILGAFSIDFRLNAQSREAAVQAMTGGLEKRCTPPPRTAWFSLIGSAVAQTSAGSPEPIIYASQGGVPEAIALATELGLPGTSVMLPRPADGRPAECVRGVSVRYYRDADKSGAERLVERIKAVERKDVCGEARALLIDPNATMLSNCKPQRAESRQANCEEVKTLPRAPGQLEIWIPKSPQEEVCETVPTAVASVNVPPGTRLGYYVAARPIAPEKERAEAINQAQGLANRLSAQGWPSSSVFGWPGGDVGPGRNLRIRYSQPELKATAANLGNAIRSVSGRVDLQVETCFMGGQFEKLGGQVEVWLPSLNSLR